MFIEADAISLGLFVVLSIVFFTFWLFWSVRGGVDRLWIGSYVVLNIVVSLLAVSGITLRYVIPLAPLLMLTMIGFAIGFSYSNSTKKIVENTPLYGLIGIQTFRLPLEIILHQWAKQGTIPETMTWTGSNFDIVSGILCLVFIPVVQKNSRAAWIPQVISFVLLLNVVRVVIMSSPFPFAWNLERPIELIFHFPYALIAPVFVLPALAIHLMTFRKLIEQKVKIVDKVVVNYLSSEMGYFML